MVTTTQTTSNRRQGAASARREDLDPIDLVSRIMNDHPAADIDEVCRLVRKALAGRDARFQDSFNNYTTRNHFNLLQRRIETPLVRRTRPRVSPEQRQQETQQAQQRAEQTVDTIRQIVLMELPTGFGKPLGDLTESEGMQLVGWQASLFAGLGNKRLREAKTEADLQAAWKAAVFRSTP